MTLPLPPHEERFATFMASPGNVVGWRAEGRDVDGHAIVRADFTLPDGSTQTYRMKLAREGHMHYPPSRKILPTRMKRKERAAVVSTGLQSTASIRCPSDGTLLVEDRGWLRCPTPKCSVLVR